jgi:hypothetical protein
MKSPWPWTDHLNSIGDGEVIVCGEAAPVRSRGITILPFGHGSVLLPGALQYDNSGPIRLKFVKHVAPKGLIQRLHGPGQLPASVTTPGSSSEGYLRTYASGKEERFKQGRLTASVVTNDDIDASTILDLSLVEASEINDAKRIEHWPAAT